MARKKKNKQREISIILEHNMILGNKVLLSGVENIITEQELDILLKTEAFKKNITIKFK